MESIVLWTLLYSVIIIPLDYWETFLVYKKISCKNQIKMSFSSSACVFLNWFLKATIWHGCFNFVLVYLVTWHMFFRFVFRSFRKTNVFFVLFLGVLETTGGRKLLVSGWWGLVRHPNYLGEILIQWSWVLPAGKFLQWTQGVPPKLSKVKLLIFFCQSSSIFYIVHWWTKLTDRFQLQF